MPVFDCGTKVAGYMNKCLVKSILTGMEARTPGSVNAYVVGQLMELLHGMNDHMIEISGQPLEHLEAIGMELDDVDRNLLTFCGFHDLTLKVNTERHVVTFGSGQNKITVLYNSNHFRLEASDVSVAKIALNKVDQHSDTWFSAANDLQQVQEDRLLAEVLQREFNRERQIQADRRFVEALLSLEYIQVHG